MNIILAENILHLFIRCGHTVRPLLVLSALRLSADFGLTNYRYFTPRYRG